ncbi:MAG TPA: AI-2E family transporter [Herpetosiphonaceae bacterium]
MNAVERVSYKRIAGYTALVLTTLMLGYLTYRLSEVVLLFVLSIIVAAALRAPMIWLQRRRVPRGIAILLLYLLIIAVIGAIVVLMGQLLLDELRVAGERFPRRYDELLTQWEQSNQQWQQTIAGNLPHTNVLIDSVGQQGPQQVGYQVAGLTYGIANSIISLVAILTLTFYWLIDEDRFVRLWLMLLQVQHRTVARHTWQDVERRVGTFVRSESLQFVLTLVVLWLGFDALGVRYPVTWALYGALVQLIPWVGIPLTLLPAIPMFWTDPPVVAVGAVALILVVGIFMDRVVEPWAGVQGIVHPIVSVVALMIMGEAAGILGMIVALPLAATVQSILSQLVQAGTAPRTATSTQAMYSTQIQDLRARLLRLHEDVPEQPERRLAIEGMFQRLNTLLDKTEQVMQQRASAPEQRRMTTKSDLRSRIPAIFARNRSR